MADEIFTLTEQSAQEVMDVVRAHQAQGTTLSGRRAQPGGPIVGYWVEVLSATPDAQGRWEVMVLGCQYDGGEFVLFDRDETFRLKLVDPNELDLV